MSRINLQELSDSHKLSDNLTVGEIKRKSYAGAPSIDFRLPIIFEIIREYSGKRPAKINSAVRNYTPSGGVDDSAHRRGNALDIELDKQQLKLLKLSLTDWLPLAWSAGLRGFGVYTWGVHIDTEHQNIKNAWGDGRTAYPLRHWAEKTPTWLRDAGSASPLDYTFKMSLDRGFRDLRDIRTLDIQNEMDGDKKLPWWRSLLPLLLIGLLIYNFQK